MKKYAGITKDEVMLLEFVADWGGVDNWILLEKDTIKEIVGHLDDETYIRGKSQEPHIGISISGDEISIEYSWVEREKKKLVISKAGLLRIYQNIDNNGKLLVLT